VPVEDLCAGCDSDELWKKGQGNVLLTHVFIVGGKNMCGKERPGVRWPIDDRRNKVASADEVLSG
jgi:hypothetical protein